MKSVKAAGDLLGRLCGLALGLLVLSPAQSSATLEQTFDVLQIGTTTYRNVTVTTKSKNYIFILHSQGMTNLKVADLPADLRTKLGYDVPSASQPKTNTPAVWARQTLAKMEVPQVKQLEAGVQSWYRRGLGASGERFSLPVLNRNVLLMLGGGLLLLYLFHSYCCLMICRKAGLEPGALVWLPVLQLVPLLKAAGMSLWWFLGFLVPGLNVLAQVCWCINITRVRGKTFLVALLLIFPLSSPFAALYLAFSGAKPRPKAERRVEIMTLEAA